MKSSESLVETQTERRGRWVLASLFALAGTAVAVHAVPAWRSLMQFDRERVASGEIWRLVTGHWAHWSLDHLVWDVAAFGLLALLAVRLTPPSLAPRRLPALLGVAALAISLSVWWLAPEIRLYRGLSGIDAGLFTYVAAGLLRRDRRSAVVGGIALALFVAKVGWEMSTGGAMFVGAQDAGFVTVTLAHLVGAAVGFLFGILSAGHAAPLALPSHQPSTASPYAPASAASFGLSAPRRTASTPASLRGPSPCSYRRLRPLATKLVRRKG